jgi:hypothetical protein
VQCLDDEGHTGGDEEEEGQRTEVIRAGDLEGADGGKVGVGRDGGRCGGRDVARAAVEESGGKENAHDPQEERIAPRQPALDEGAAREEREHEEEGEAVAGRGGKGARTRDRQRHEAGERHRRGNE